MDIRAFSGFRFDQAVVGNVGDCIAPPYDVIDADMQGQLYDKNPCNIVRVIKGKELENDDESANKYSRAAESFNQWTENGALKADETETIYAYVQDFNINGQGFQRSGFIALGKLAEFGKGVQPHERTLDGPKADRLNLMTATKAQFGQIFMLFDDPKCIADEVIARSAARSPLLDYTESDVRHRLFPIDAPEDIRAIMAMMSDKQPVIADGHHRYETALNYSRQSGNPAAQYRMMTFVNMRNEGLVILPTHRLVSNLKDFSIDKTITAMSENFQIDGYEFADDDSKSKARKVMFNKLDKEFQAGRNAFGIYAADGSFYVAVLKDSAIMDDLCKGMSKPAKGLDVNVLHSLILDEILGIGEKELASQSNIKYIKDIGDAIDMSVAKVDSGDAQVVFFMNSTRIEQVRQIAIAGEKMPQKSTFFHPKIYTGLVINRV